ncbi:MAG: ATP-binding protein [Variovorax sp.]
MSTASPGEAGPLSLKVQAKVRDGRPLIEIVIEDESAPFDPLSLPEPDRSGPAEDMQLGGLGVMLIRRLSDVQHHARGPCRGNTFTLAKFLPATGGT